MRQVRAGGSLSDFVQLVFICVRTYKVYDLTEMDFHAAFIQVGVPCGVVDKL
jgi:hypothetical protein